MRTARAVEERHDDAAAEKHAERRPQHATGDAFV